MTGEAQRWASEGTEQLAHSSGNTEGVCAGGKKEKEG